MALVLRKLQLPGVPPGCPWSLWAVGSECSCPLEEFLRELNKSSPKSFKRITAILKQASKAGPQFHNKEICKRLKGMGAGSFLQFSCSVKGGHGVRVLGFLDQGHMIICTHGFSKKSDDTPPSELDTLKTKFEAYHKAKRENRIVRKED